MLQVDVCCICRFIFSCFKKIRLKLHAEMTWYEACLLQCTGLKLQYTNPNRSRGSHLLLDRDWVSSSVLLLSQLRTSYIWILQSRRHRFLFSSVRTKHHDLLTTFSDQTCECIVCTGLKRKMKSSTWFYEAAKCAATISAFSSSCLFAHFLFAHKKKWMETQRIRKKMGEVEKLVYP